MKRGKNKKEAKYLIPHALDFKINYLDTANDYSAEPFIGEAIKDINRKSVVLSRKIDPGNENSFDYLQKQILFFLYY